MKSYLFLMLLVLIACDDEKKTDEIVLKSSNQNIIEKIAKIFAQCGPENGDCFMAELKDFFYNLNAEDYTEFENFRITSECQNVCVPIFTNALKDEHTSEVLCSIYVCTYSN